MNAQLLANVQNFTRNRLIELCGFLLVIFSTFLLISILSYSPSDPNFIYSSEKSEIKNIAGFTGVFRLIFYYKL